jgi:hypothetical protein
MYTSLVSNATEHDALLLQSRYSTCQYRPFVVVKERYFEIAKTKIRRPGSCRDHGLVLRGCIGGYTSCSTIRVTFGVGDSVTNTCKRALSAGNIISAYNADYPDIQGEMHSEGTNTIIRSMETGSMLLAEGTGCGW